MDAALEGHSKATKALLQKVKSWLWNDPVSALYRDLFAKEAIVDPPMDPGFDDDLERRTAQKIPPGFGAKDTVVEEVRREQIILQPGTAVLLPGRRFWAQQAVKRWLSTFAESVEETGGFPDLWMGLPRAALALR